MPVFDCEERVRSRARAAGWSLLAWFSAPAFALASGGGGQSDPVASVVLSLAILLAAAKLGGHLAVRLGQPAVLGELLAGVVLGNLQLAGIDRLSYLASDPHLDMLARIGVLVLLFEVGLASTIGQLLQVGLSSLLVACIGVAAPFAFGWAVGAWLLPGGSVYLHVFLGATITATSVGITARVFKDLGRSQSGEARIILGAAVIDDILGLVLLAAVCGAITAVGSGSSFSYAHAGLILLKATAFLLGALLLGVKFSPRLFQVASRLQGTGVLLSAGLCFCFVLAWLADQLGLAPIVGAFAAGLILEELHYGEFRERGESGLEELLYPISAFLVPIFFVLMGIRTNLESLADPGVLKLALALTVAAILGKQLCGLGVLTRGVDRVTVGLGMIPRGEVGLVFANMGLTLKLGGVPILDPSSFSACVAMVIVTTLVTPPLLQWRLRKSDPEPPPPGDSA